MLQSNLLGFPLEYRNGLVPIDFVFGMCGNVALEKEVTKIDTGLVLKCWVFGFFYLALERHEWG